MEVLYLLNIVFFIVISVQKVVFMTKFFNFSFFNPITIPFIVSLPVLLFMTFMGPLFVLDNGLFNPWFNYALLMTNIYLLGTYIVMVLVLRTCRKSEFINEKLLKIIKPIEVKRVRMVVCSLVFLFLFFCTFVLLSQKFGLVNWILSPRTGYQLYRTGVGHWYALSLLFLSTSYAIAALYSKKLINLLIITFFYVFLVYLLGSKGSILSFVTFFMIVLWYRGSRHLKRILYVVIPIGFGVMLLNFNPNDIMEVVKYFDYYVNSAMYYEAYHKGAINLFYGKIWLTEFYEYIPRFLFPDKPFVYGILYVNEYFFPGAAEATNTPAFGGPISYYADFGVIGVVLAGFFSVGNAVKSVMYYVFYQNTNLADIQYNSNRLYLFIWILAPSFMTFFGIFYSLILFFMITKIIAVTNRIKVI